jgi:hypothetical protein
VLAFARGHAVYSAVNAVTLFFKEAAQPPDREGAGGGVPHPPRFTGGEASGVQYGHRHGGGGGGGGGGRGGGGGSGAGVAGAVAGAIKAEEEGQHRQKRLKTEGWSQVQ